MGIRTRKNLKSQNSIAFLNGYVRAAAGQSWCLFIGVPGTISLLFWFEIISSM